MPDESAPSLSLEPFFNPRGVAVIGASRDPLKLSYGIKRNLTDAEHAVVLRWPDRCLVVSPQQHAFFAEADGKRAGLSR